MSQSIRTRWVVALGLSLVATGLATRANAADRDEPDAEVEALGTHQRHLRLDLGARTQYVSSAGLDPFSERDAIPQVSLGASYAFWAQDSLSVAGALGFDYGSRSATARSADTSLDLMRFTLAPEARYHLLRILVLTAKVGPTLTREKAVMQNGLDTDLEDISWKLGFDATAGVALELFGYHSGKSRAPRLWLMGEGGYGYTASNQLLLHPEKASSAPERSEALALQDLSVSGPLFKISAGLSFW